MFILFSRAKVPFFPFLIFCILPPLTSGQDLQHDVSVTLKLVQVYVMDSQDRPVTDLKAEDFFVYDNKKTVRITDFERYILDLSQKQASPAPPEEHKTGSSESAVETMNRKFFLFFDLANNSTQGFRKAQEAARHFIDTQLHPTDEVGILTFSVTKGLKMHEYLSTDRAVVRSAVEKLGKEGLVGRVENFEAELYRELSGQSALDASQASKPISVWSPGKAGGVEPQSITEGRPDTTADPFLRRARAKTGRLEHKSVTTHLLESLSNLSKAMRYIPGHKHMLFFSSGIPYSLIFGDKEQVNPIDRLLIDRYEKMLQEFSNANTSVFSLNTEPMITDVNVPFYYKGEKTLQKISQYTGGKFLGNVQNYAELLGMVQTFTGSYYVLGYYVDEAWDGRYHDIKVEVNRPGLKVFAQKGYFNPKAFSKYSKMEKEMHLIDLALSERPQLQAPVEMPAIAVPLPYEDKAAIMLMAQAPGSPIEESIGKRAEIFFLVFDKDENLVTLKRKEIEQAALKNKEASFYSILPVSPGLYKCRVVVRDTGTGRGAVGRYRVEIPAFPSQGLLLFPPFLLSRGKSGLFVRGYTPETKNKGFPLVEFFPFDPREYAPLLGDIPGESSSINAVMHCLVKGLSNPQIRFTAQLREKDLGSVYPVPVSVVSGNKVGDIGTILVDFKMPGAAPGNYILTVKAADTSTGAVSQTSLAFKIAHPGQ